MTARASSSPFFVMVPVCVAFATGCSGKIPTFGSSEQSALPATSSSSGGGTTSSPVTSGAHLAGSSSSNNVAMTQNCGNGMRDDAEECDEGPRNSNSATTTCLTDCKIPRCGDGVLSLTEECDQGMANDDLLAGACRTNCLAAYCGDGVIDEPGEDRCDEGEANSDTAPNACRTNCYRPTCGDGVRDVGETCDLGSENSDVDESVGCSTACRSALCGNGQLNTGEDCDDGPANSDIEPGACRTSCQKATCGDGVIDPPEACDDARENSDTQADHCRSDCTKPRCGDGVKDTTESCDGDDGCDAECKQGVCGDGVVASNEECDDGNGNNADSAACTTQCKEATCGDGLVLEGTEECDDGAENRDNTYGACRTDCHFGERCGDGVVQGEEQCDGGPDCNATCQFGACNGGQLRCGDQDMCIDPLTNGQFCGASNDCQGDNDGYVCPANSQCTGGRCQCSNNGVICDSRCIDPKTDSYFCGATDNCAGDDKNGTPCENGSQCENGLCVAQCNDTQKRCGDNCIPKTGCCETEECPSGMECTDGNECQCTGGKVTCGDECLPSGTCCEASDCSSGSACRDGTCVEADPPGVTGVTPLNGAVGVFVDVTIVVTFDEPMNEGAVQSATRLAGFGVEPLNFSWNEGSTQMSIVPTNDLFYQSAQYDPGGDEMEAFEYELVIGTGAQDLNGNGLASEFKSTFKTARYITRDIQATVATTSDGSTELPDSCSGSTLGKVGVTGGAQNYIFAHINAWPLPPLEDIQIVEATLMANQKAPEGAFYTSNAGNTQLTEVQPTEVDIFYIGLEGAGVRAELGRFTFNDASPLEYDITNHFKGEFERDYRALLYRLAPGGSPPDNSNAQFECGSIKVAVTYLGP